MMGNKRNSEHVDTERTQQVGRVRHSIKKLNKPINVEATNQKSTMLGSEMEEDNYASHRHLKTLQRIEKIGAQTSVKKNKHDENYQPKTVKQTSGTALNRKFQDIVRNNYLNASSGKERKSQLDDFSLPSLRQVYGTNSKRQLGLQDSTNTTSKKRAQKNRIALHKI